MSWLVERRTAEGIDTEKERIICLIHERLRLSARSSRRVPPLMAPSPFLLLALSFHFSLFCLAPPRTSLTVLIFLHHPSCQTSPPPPLLPLYIIPLSSPPQLLLSLPRYPQLISSSYLICRSFRFNFLTLSALECTHVPVLFPSYSLVSSAASLRR